MRKEIGVVFTDKANNTKMIKVAVIDDDKSFIDKIVGYLKRYSEENQIEISAVPFSTGEELLFKYESIYDIIFMDIEMPKMNGMDAARKIRQFDRDVIIIFVTNMAQYAINGYEVGALDFVLKPVQYFPFSIKLGKAVRALKQHNGIEMVVPYLDGMKKISSEKIIYAEIRNHWLHIITADFEYKLLLTMKQFYEKVKPHHFICCSSSYCINLKYVTGIQKDIVELDEKYQIRISRSHKKEVREKLMNYYTGGEE